MTKHNNEQDRGFGNEEFPEFEDLLKSDEEIIRSTTDPTDFVEREERSKRIKGIIISLSAIAVLLLFAYGIYLVMQESEPVAPTPTPSSTSISPTEQTKEEILENTETNVTIEKPLLSIIPNPVDVTSGEVSIEAGETGFTTSNDINIVFEDAVIEGAQYECSVSSIVDLCFAGTVTIGENTSYVYYLKDAAHSNLFENPENFVEVDINGATASALMDIKLSSQDKEKVLAIVFSDMSGLMITFDNSENAESFVSSITVG